MKALRVAIVDYGLGNLYSVKWACAHAGLDTAITSDRRELHSAHGIILPGGGAFGVAMATLHRLDLSWPLQDAAAAGRSMLGICLGIQLRMSRSEEFGALEGLGILVGTVKRFDGPRERDRPLKVPEICRNGIRRLPGAEDPWKNTPLEGQQDGEPMCFVLSCCVQPDDETLIFSTTRYGQFEYCFSLRRGDLFAFQFHPDRRGVEGLKTYLSWARLLARRHQGES